MESHNLPWFALTVRTRWEKGVATVLASKGYECWCPQYRTMRRWSDRMKEVELPLFPGYLFCSFDPYDRLPLLQTPGVTGVVSFANGPEPVNATDLAAVRNVVESGLETQPWPYLQVGQRVEVQRGPLAGIEGILLSHKAGFRIVVSMDLLKRSVAVEVDRASVAPVSNSSSLPHLGALCAAGAR
ncbi:MAG TPA: UpxY family transcription antiterminator [Terriglobales bacterium]|jgi:transcription antitermination factor NusG|nr:UpxY family transcription antiterminator [Terriglobales bacterium]